MATSKDVWCTVYIDWKTNDGEFCEDTSILWYSRGVSRCKCGCKTLSMLPPQEMIPSDTNYHQQWIIGSLPLYLKCAALDE